jgi:hypothetical protein
MHVDLWHPLYAQTTYDALLTLVTTRDFDRFFDHFPLLTDDGLTETRRLFDSIDDVVTLWEYIDGDRPKNPLDPDLDWCVLSLSTRKSQKDLAQEYTRLIYTQLTPTTTLKDFVCRRTPEFAQILHHPPAEHRDLLEHVCHALGRWICSVPSLNTPA